MSHKIAKKARRLARELAREQKLVFDPQQHDTSWKRATVVNRRTGQKFMTERPQVTVNPASFDGLVNKLKKELK